MMVSRLKEASEIPCIEIEHLQMTFDHRHVLDDINLVINQGEFIGLIGANGAGKSTLLKIILGLIKPSKGTVKLQGKPLKIRQGLIGYVPQKLYIATDTPLRGRDFVSLGFDGNKWGIPLSNKVKTKKVDAIIQDVGATDFATQAIGTLSGGEQQRLLIAQALLANPKILVLDEPLSNLDIKNTYEIVQLIARISQAKNITVILVAHDSNPLLDVMSRVLYLADGKAIIGTVKEVFQTEVLSRLYGYKVEVLNINNRILVMGDDNVSLNPPQENEIDYR